MTPDFLTADEVVAIHTGQIERFGGAPGLRDRGLLESAVAQPQAAFGGEFLHEDLYAMAAAHLFHLVSNHALIDGNKRIGLAAALVFLELNAIVVRRGTDDLNTLTLEVAQGRLEKPAIAARLRQIAATGWRDASP